MMCHVMSAWFEEAAIVSLPSRLALLLVILPRPEPVLVSRGQPWSINVCSGREGTGRRRRRNGKALTSFNSTSGAVYHAYSMFTNS